LLGITVLGVATLKFGFVLPLLAGVGLGLVALFLARPDMVLPLYVALAYANGLAILGSIAGNASLVGVSLTGLLGLTVFMNWFVRQKGVAIDRPFLLMILFLAAVLASAMLAKDVELAFSWILTYLLEGVVLYFLIINSIRRLETLRTVIWTLMFVASVLSTLGVYQEVTHSYHLKFGGLMERNLEHGLGNETDSSEGFGRSREKILISNRATGPAGGPNRFAQNLLFVLPLAMMQMWSERKKSLKIAAGVATLLILCGVFLTYSRGGFLALVVLMAIMILLGYLRIRHFVLGFGLVLFLVSVLAPGYLTRMDTMRGMNRFTEDIGEKKSGDGAIRGRLTEMLAALNVFLDYPLLGVGPGHYSPYYSIEYMSNPRIAFRALDTTRRAHSLYFELAAETGVIGLALFLAMILHVLRALWGLRRRWMQTRSDLANLATGLFLGLLMYYTTGLFLHLSFQRYYWLFFGMAAAAIQLLRQAEGEEAAAADACVGAGIAPSARSPRRLSADAAPHGRPSGTVLRV
jgi:hypothetical protein